MGRCWGNVEPLLLVLQSRLDGFWLASVRGGYHPLLCGSLFDQEIDPTLEV